GRHIVERIAADWNRRGGCHGERPNQQFVIPVDLAGEYVAVLKFDTEPAGLLPRLQLARAVDEVLDRRLPGVFPDPCARLRSGTETKRAEGAFEIGPTQKANLRREVLADLEVVELCPVAVACVIEAALCA